MGVRGNLGKKLLASRAWRLKLAQFSEKQAQTWPRYVNSSAAEGQAMLTGVMRGLVAIPKGRVTGAA